MKKVLCSIILLALASCGQKEETDSTATAVIESSRNEIMLTSTGTISLESDFDSGELGCRVMEGGDKVLILAVTKAGDSIIELFQFTDTSGAIKVGKEEKLKNEGLPIPAVHYMNYGENMHFTLPNTETCSVSYTSGVSDDVIKGSIDCKLLTQGEDNDMSIKASFSCSKDEELEAEVNEVNYEDFSSIQ